MLLRRLRRGGQHAYGPFAQALDQLARVIDPSELHAALGGAGGELTRLLPDLPVRLGELSRRRTADPDTERHRLHTAVTDLLDGGSDAGVRSCSSSRCPVGRRRRRCCCSRHLARAAGGRASARDVPGPEVDASEALAHDAGGSAPIRRVVRLRLTGLSRMKWSSSSSAPDERRVGADLPEVAHAISDLTGGNPFLVCEFWRALRETKAVEVAARAHSAHAPPRRSGHARRAL